MGTIVYITEIDPICALQAAMDGFQVVNLEDFLHIGDLFLTCTGNKNVINRKHMDKMKSGAILGNMGHHGNEINLKSVKNSSDLIWEKLRTRVSHIVWPDGKRLILLADGKILNYMCSSVPSLVLSITACTQLLALVEMNTSPKSRYVKNNVYIFPKKLDELVAKLHLEQCGGYGLGWFHEQGSKILFSEQGFIHVLFEKYQSLNIHNISPSQT